MIFQYLEFCKEQNFDPLSRSTLYRIMDVREASQRKSLQGFDNIASDGASGFESLENIIQELEKIDISKELADTKKRFLREGKRYFKTNYVTHCQEAESTCADHCRNFALSDPIDKHLQKKCSHSHELRKSQRDPRGYKDGYMHSNEYVQQRTTGISIVRQFQRSCAS